MTSFDVHRTERGIGVIAPVGRLTVTSARDLTREVGDLVADGVVRIVVDLDRTEFIDSSGLGALIAGLKSARQAGGDLRLARPTEQVSTVLTLTNLDRVLRPRDSVDGAFDVA